MEPVIGTTKIANRPSHCLEVGALPIGLSVTELDFCITCHSALCAPTFSRCITAGLIPGSADPGWVLSPLPVTSFNRPRSDLRSSSLSVRAAAEGASSPCRSTTNTPLSLLTFSSTDQDCLAQMVSLSPIEASIARTLMTSCSLMASGSFPVRVV